MKPLILSSICAVVLLGSCSTVYRSGQTPDDVYYSPAPQVNSTGGGTYVEANSGRNDGRRYQQSQSQEYSAYDSYATPDDRWLMMRVRNRPRWSVFDDYNYYSPYNDWSYGYGSPYGYGSGFGYGSPGFSFGFSNGFYSPYSYGLGFGYNNFYNNYYNWNYAYNPYYPSVIVINPKTNPAGYTRMRSFNFNNYSNRNYNTNRSQPRYYNPRQYGSAPPSTNYGSGRRIYSNSNNNSYSTPSNDRPVRSYTPSNNNNSYTPSSGGSSGGGNSSGGGGGGRRPGR